MTASFVSITATLNLDLLPRSLTRHDSIEHGLVKTNNGGRQAILAPVGSSALLAFDAERSK